MLNHLEFGKISGIYCFQNKVNQKRYIGKSVDIKVRIRTHLWYLRKGKNDSLTLQKAWDKYGEENFTVYVIEECPEELLSEKEMFYIKQYKSNCRDCGYNLTEGGEGSTGYKWTEEQILKRSGENHPGYGKKFSEEIRQKMVANHANFKKENHPQWGRHHTEETRRKIGKANSKYRGKKSKLFGVPKTKEHKENYSKSRFGTKDRDASSKYYGVCKKYYPNPDEITNKPKVNRWKSQVKVNRASVRIGYYPTELEAAKAYDRFVIENNLTNPLNFPTDFYFSIYKALREKLLIE